MVWLPLSYGMHRRVDHVCGAAINRCYFNKVYIILSAVIISNIEIMFEVH